jgi:hypothetical protein
MPYGRRAITRNDGLTFGVDPRRKLVSMIHVPHGIAMPPPATCCRSTRLWTREDGRSYGDGCISWVLLVRGRDLNARPRAQGGIELFS